MHAFSQLATPQLAALDLGGRGIDESTVPALGKIAAQSPLLEKLGVWDSDLSQDGPARLVGATGLVLDDRLPSPQGSVLLVSAAVAATLR